MKGNTEILKVLNELLSDELTAIHQYMVEAEMCENWGYDKLHAAFQKIAIDEMHHAEWLIQRILFLEGQPTIKLGELNIGATVSDMINGLITAEAQAVGAYNKAIALAHQVADQGTVDLLIKILTMEEGHIDWAEAQRDQIEHMGIANYLSMQTEGATE
ncbi:MAG: bacterioferritin [Armatimonadota bacterium]|nr:MAG: bacterioferritin [Armatimonadota bacterium]